MTSLGTSLKEASVSDWCFQAEPKTTPDWEKMISLIKSRRPSQCLVLTIWQANLTWNTKHPAGCSNGFVASQTLCLHSVQEEQHNINACLYEMKYHEKKNPTKKYGKR